MGRMEEGRKIPVQVVGPIVGENEVIFFCRLAPPRRLSPFVKSLHSSWTGSRPRGAGALPQPGDQPGSKRAAAHLVAQEEQ